MGITFVLVGVLIGSLVTRWVFVDDEKEEFYKNQIQDLTEQRNRYINYINRYHDKIEDAEIYRGKTQLYESILNKLLGEKSQTDVGFMFEGNFYSAQNFNLERNPGEADTLTVEFTSIGIPFNSKGE